MKLLRFIFILTFAFLTQFGYSQNYVSKEVALERIEVKQASVKADFEEGSLDQMKLSIYNYFFEMSVIYLKDGSDIPETLSVSFEKCLNRFENNQEDVVVVKEEISNLLLIN